MSHPLEQQIDSVRRKAKLYLWLYSCGMLVAVLLGAVLFFCLLDYIFRYQDPGLRVLSSGAVLVVAGWAAYRYLLPVLSKPLTQRRVAAGLQRRFPELKDQLVTALDFLKAPETDPVAGSPALRRAVISQASAELEGMRVNSAVDGRPARRALWTVAGLAALAAIVFATDSQLSSLALSRLVVPWSSAPWPRHNHLAFREVVERVGRGENFEVELIDLKDNLPETARITYRSQSEDGSTVEDVVELQRTKDKLMARRDNVQGPFEYRAEAGDDTTMPWTAVEVVELPRVEGLSVALQPPQYTGWPAATSQGHIAALAGTQVSIAGRSSKPLSSATLHHSGGVEVIGRIADDGLSFVIPADDSSPLLVEKSGQYWIELSDNEGFVGGRDDRWEIKAIVDQPPEPVSIEQPSADQVVLPEAVIPLKLKAHDDVALASVSLRYMRSDQSDKGDQEIVLWQSDGAAVVLDGAPALLAGQKEAREVVHQWDLAPLGLQPGMQLSYYAAALDHKPQLGQSLARSIKIVTHEEMAERMARSQSRLLGELSRILKMQEEGRQEVSALAEQLRGTGRMREQDMNQLQFVERNQRDVARGLTSPSEGIASMLSSMRDELEMNKLDSPDLERQLQQIAEEIELLARNELPVIERELTSAMKSAHPSDNSSDGDTISDAVSASIATAGDHQDQVIEALRRLTAELGQAEDFRQLSLDVSDVRRGQQDLADATRQILPETVTKHQRDLSPQQQTDLRKLAQQQGELSRRLDRIQSRMNGLQQKLSSSDPLVAGAIEDALHATKSGSISSEMRESGADLERNQLGQSLEKQARALDKLEDVLNILANRRESELARLVKKLRETKASLAELSQQQEQVRNDLAVAAAGDQPTDAAELKRLAEREQHLAEDAKRLTRQLQRLEANAAADSLANAANSMASASEAGQQGQSSPAAEHAQDASQQLQDAERALDQQTAQAEQDLIDEQVAKIEDGIIALRERQAAARTETERLDSVRADGELTAGQKQSLSDLAKTQTAIVADTQHLAKELAPAAVFQLALERVASEMALAAGLLEREYTSPAVRYLQSEAEAGLAQLLTALERDPSDPSENSDANTGNSGDAEAPASSGPPPEGIPRLAQLKLLKMLQEKINASTEQQRKLRAAGQPQGDDDLAYEQRLADDQRRLADLVFQLVGQPEVPAGETPTGGLNVDPQQKSAPPEEINPQARPGGI